MLLPVYLCADEMPAAPPTCLQFLRQIALANVTTSLPPDSHAHSMPPTPPTIGPGALTPFVDPLPIPPILEPAGVHSDPTNSKLAIPHYRVAEQQFTQRLHPALQPPRLWGHGGCAPGPTIETVSGKPLLVEWINQLPDKHFLPIDYRLHGAMGQPQVRTVVHVHGAKAPPESDGYPEDWYVPGKSARYYYPNHQDAAALWYHDHAMGSNRLNIYAGLFGSYVIRDDAE